MFNEATLSLDGCIFEGNSAEDDGGAVANLNVLVISNCEFSDNRAKQGGAIVTIEKTVIRNSIFAGNCARFGGGAILSSGELEIYESELTAEQATSEYTLIAIEKDKELGEDGTIWIAPCLETASSAYCKLVVEIIAK